MSKRGRGRRQAIQGRELSEKAKRKVVGRAQMSDRSYVILQHGERNYGTKEKPFTMPIYQFIREAP